MSKTFTNRSRGPERRSAYRDAGDPTRQFHKQLYHSHDLQHKDWNDMPPPRNPALVAKAHALPYQNHQRMALMPDDLMPCGPHQGKSLRQVPRTDLQLHWIHREALRKCRWPEWDRVLDYLDRFPVDV